MKAESYQKSSWNRLPSDTANRWTMLILVVGHVCCIFLIWSFHNQGLELWMALPLINLFVTRWLLARSPP